jgi:hypothetical protein
MRRRILIIYYSQSGDVARLAEALTNRLDPHHTDLVWERILPRIDYPYPWPLYRFLDVFPECVNGDPPEIHPPQFDANADYDLVIVAYQVWYLAPSLPIQAFMRSSHATVLRNKKVITLVGCRGMWHSASAAMKKLISGAGGIHIDNIVVQHQGSPIATLITTPRLLLTGKKDRFLGLMPAAGFRDRDIASLSRFGERLAEKLETLKGPSREPLFAGLQAVTVNQHLVFSEIIGFTIYRLWAQLTRRAGRAGDLRRAPLIWSFALLLVLTVPFVLLFSALAGLFARLLFPTKFNAYVNQLRSPSEPGTPH